MDQGVSDDMMISVPGYPDEGGSRSCFRSQSLRRRTEGKASGGSGARAMSAGGVIGGGRRG